jgi:hypothetical protein
VLLQIFSFTKSAHLVLRQWQKGIFDKLLVRILPKIGSVEGE